MTRLIQLAVLVALVVGCDARSTSDVTGHGSSAGKAAKNGPLVRWNFVGPESLAANTNAARLRNVLAEPTTRAVLNDIVGKLARCATNIAPPGALKPGQDIAPLIVPLLEDVLAHESTGLVIEDAAGGGIEMNLAIRIPADRSTLWRTNWEKAVAILGASGTSEVRGEDALGIQARWTAVPVVSDLLKTGDWTLLFWGTGSSKVSAQWIDTIKTSGRPVEPDKEAWLTLGADLERLASLFHWPADVAWPAADLKFIGRGANLRTTGRLVYAGPLGLRIEPWRIPTNTISDPLVAFTAVQGIKPWLSSRRWVKEGGFGTPPNQVFAWAQAHIPFRTYLSWETDDPTNVVRNVAQRLPTMATNSLYWAKLSRVDPGTNGPKFLWRGFMMAEPFIQLAAPADKRFVLSGIFPPDPKFVPPPPDLYARVIGRTNLVYYDWELTQLRIGDWHRMREVYSMNAGYDAPNKNTPAYRWITDTNVVRHFDNAITEITVVSPKELNFVRSSSIGLTSLEITLLARWLDDPAFPKLSRPPLSRTVIQRDQANELPPTTRKTGARPGPTRVPPAAPPAPPPPAPR